MVSYVLMPNYRGDPTICQSARPFSRQFPRQILLISPLMPSVGLSYGIICPVWLLIWTILKHQIAEDAQGAQRYAEFFAFSLHCSATVPLGSRRLRGI